VQRPPGGSIQPPDFATERFAQQLPVDAMFVLAPRCRTPPVDLYKIVNHFAIELPPGMRFKDFSEL
jgi:hypothetical protein